ncbi:PepSY domain-containing protein [Arthrobacter sp. MYb227]|uniref:PepSY domain-containing protein n=1 Tax=Arthrobacter sp. MYb227 TaxID=1848601 RepID=UPI0015E36E91|nr:PepSY domain-containing protein [Arthrobacter sp. MYb227]
MTPAIRARRFHLLPALTMVGVAALALAGCSGQTPPQSTVTVTATPSQLPVPESPTISTPAPSTPTAGSSQDTGATAASTRYAALAKAAQSAQSAIEGTVTSIESKDAGTWEVSVFTKQDTEHEVHISADGTTVLSGPSEQRLGSNVLQRYRSLVDSAKIDVIAAAQMVEKESPQGLIDELDLDSWRGTTTWEAEVKEDSQTREIYLDAMTGAVLKNELD